MTAEIDHTFIRCDVNAAEVQALTPAGSTVTSVAAMIAKRGQAQRSGPRAK